MSTIIAQIPSAFDQTNIFKAYSASAFNSKYDIANTSKIDMNAAAHSVGALLRKYKLNDLLGVCNIHNHFKLNDDEIILTRVDNNRVLLKALGPESDLVQDSVPYMWAIDKETKKLFAFQFFDGKCETIVKRFTELGQRLHALTSFYAEFIELATKLDLADVLGIFLIYNDLITYANAEESLLEQTDIILREQRMKPAAFTGEGATITHWTFRDDTQEDRCHGYCVWMSEDHKRFHDYD